MDKTYQEACDDVYADSITDLELIRDDCEQKEAYGLDVALKYLKDKRKELYG